MKALHLVLPLILLLEDGDGVSEPMLWHIRRTFKNFYMRKRKENAHTHPPQSFVNVGAASQACLGRFLGPRMHTFTVTVMKILFWLLVILRRHAHMQISGRFHQLLLKHTLASCQRELCFPHRFLRHFM